MNVCVYNATDHKAGMQALGGSKTVRGHEVQVQEYTHYQKWQRSPEERRVW